MPQLRDDIIEWAATGRLEPACVDSAFEIAGVSPGRSEWRAFLETLLLWTGSILLATGVIFFFAYNWQSLHRFGKFALAETVFAIALVVALQFGLERPAGKAALLAAALLSSRRLEKVL